MLSLIRRWILPSPSSTSVPGFFSPHYVPPISLTAHRVTHFSTYPPLHSDNKPSNPGTKPSNSKPHPPPASSSNSSSATSPRVPPPSEDTLKPVVTPAWNELMTILTKHVYDSSWTPEAQARYSQIIKQYPYISPETQYNTGLPVPGGLTPREACQSAAEEALFADYRPLRAGFAEDYLESGEEVEGEVALDFGNGIMHLPVSRIQLVDLLKAVAGQDIVGPSTPFVSAEKPRNKIMEMTSTRRKRYIKMKNHKRRKLRRRQRTEKRKLGKI